MKIMSNKEFRRRMEEVRSEECEKLYQQDEYNRRFRELWNTVGEQTKRLDDIAKQLAELKEAIRKPYGISLTETAAVPCEYHDQSRNP